MKLIGLLCADAVAATAVPAMAQMTHTETRTTRVEHSTGYRAPMRMRHHNRRVCTMQRYHHRQVRRCTWR